MVGTKNSGRRKLTPEQREAIVQSKDLTCFLALDYGISRGTIYKIRREAEARLPQKTWVPSNLSPKDNETRESNGRQAQVGRGV